MGNIILILFMDRVFNLASKAMAGSPAEVIERTSVVRFCAGLVDKEIGQHVSFNTDYRRQNALMLYNRFNQSRALVKGNKKNTVKFEPGVRRISILRNKNPNDDYEDEEVHVRQVQPSKPQTTEMKGSGVDGSNLIEAIKKLTEEMANMRKDLQANSEITKKNTDLLESRNRQGTWRRDTSGSRSPGRGQSPRRGSCWDCGKDDHFRGDAACPFKRGQDRQQEKDLERERQQQKDPKALELPLASKE